MATTTSPSPGLHGTSLDEYLAIDAVSASQLFKLSYRSPWHVRYGERKETEAMGLGSLLHAMVLEPETVGGNFYRFEGDKRSNAKKDEWDTAEGGGLTVVRAKAWDEIRTQADEIRSRCAKLISRGTHFEQTMIWEDPKTGLLCKGRLDMATDTGLVDFKRSRNGHPQAFVGACRRYGHHWQAAWYLRGARALGLPAQTWTWVVCEDGGPITEYETTPGAVLVFETEINSALERYADCVRSNHWPAYEAEELDLSSLASDEAIIFTEE